MTFGSLFSGCGGFDYGFDQAGWSCSWQCEIDKTARAVLAHHWPDVPRHEDVRAVGKRNLSRVDAVVGGFPCQDVSTAGRRAGFEGGERSSLWFEMLRVVRELQPAFVVWENVPGLLSADDGRAFGWVLRGLADLGFDGGWRIVDAQFFGVPQQRRRVFGVFARGRFGAERAAEILALAEGVRRRTPKGRKAGKGTAAATAGSPGGGGVRLFTELGEGHVTYQEAEVAAALRINTGGGSQAANLAVYGGGQGGDARRVAACLSAKGERIDFDTDNFVLTGGVGCQAPDATPKGRVDGLAYTLTGRQQRGHGNGMAVAFNWQGDSNQGADLGMTETPCLSVATLPAVMAFAENSRDEVRESDLAPCLQQPGGRPGHGYPAVRVGAVVRRLMPVECERLMGWPDHWTRYRGDGSEIADGPRYRMCGNGVVGTVAKWLALRTRAVAEGA